MLDRSNRLRKFTYISISVIDRNGVLFIYEDMSIHPPRSSAEEKPTREQLTVNPVGAAVTSRPANGAIDSSQQSEPELGEPQPASKALSHAEKLLGLAAKLCGVRRSL